MEPTYDIYEEEDDDILDDRHSRFQGLIVHGNGSAAHRERAASQPPRATGESLPSMLSSPPSQHFLSSSSGGPWSTSRSMLGANRGQPVPIRSSSVASHSHSHFSSAMRDRPFPSTYEDDESESPSDNYPDRYIPPSLGNNIRGRPVLSHDPSRSRSQSLVTGRQAPIGSSPFFNTTSAMQSWNESYLSNTGNGHKTPGASRYGSLGVNIAAGRSDVSNMSPFTRDVDQILRDDAPLRDLWLGMNPPRDETNGGGSSSGTTSRRHSVSIEPRRGNIVGFNAPGTSELGEEQQKNRLTSSTVFGSAFASATGSSGSRGGGLMLSDDDLASDLGLMNLGPNESKSYQQPLSQPSSLPIYAPQSRSPPSRDILSTYKPINLSIPSGSTYSRQTIRTPSDNDYDVVNNSPSISSSVFDKQLAEAKAAQQQQQAELRYQYLQLQQQQIQTNTGQYVRNRAPSYSGVSASLQSPISPTGSRIINPQQPPYYSQTRKYSDAHQSHQQQPPTPSTPLHSHTSSNLSDLGKGLPLHAVPPTWPLFIVEFKAGRTDLFYLPPSGTHTGLEWDNVSPDRDIRVGDLVIVEADRGKDLGKVVNDRITLEEVEAFQKMQAEKAIAFAVGVGIMGEPTSPEGTPTSAGDAAQGTSAAGPTPKKDINPKMIYGKAGPQDVQLYASKMQDEFKALQLCQSKVRAKKLPMEVIDAEFQWCVTSVLYIDKLMMTFSPGIGESLPSTLLLRSGLTLESSLESCLGKCP